MSRPRISVIIPTVAGREASLERCQRAFSERSEGATIEQIVIHDLPTCGEAWIAGAEQASGDYLHLSADDHEPHEGWWGPLVETCDAGKIPCPVVLNPDGRVQSAGGDMARANCLRTEIAEDWTPVPFAPVPSLTREQWDAIGMVPLHYFTDVWVSERGRQLGYETVLRTGYRITHWNDEVGRLASRASSDRPLYDKYLEGVA